MNIWHDIPEKFIKPENFTAVIEIPKGCKNKYELDKDTGFLRLDRILYTSTHYPANYGFIPLTLADDGDPLDVLVLSQEEILPMTLVQCYPIGVVKMVDDGASDEKILAVPCKDPSHSCYQDISQLPAHTMDEIEHFFTVYKALEGKSTVVRETLGREQAIQILSSSIDLYKTIFESDKA